MHIHEPYSIPVFLFNCGIGFTSSSTGPVTGASGPAESQWRKQKFVSPLPTSLESWWATKSRPLSLCKRPSRRVFPHGRNKRPANSLVLKRRRRLDVSRVFSFCRSFQTARLHRRFARGCLAQRYQVGVRAMSIHRKLWRWPLRKEKKHTVSTIPMHLRLLYCAEITGNYVISLDNLMSGNL